MGKNKRNTYDKVETLPNGAMLVSDYAANVANCTTPYIYELIRKGKNTFRIVDFKGINFIIPQ